MRNVGIIPFLDAKLKAEETSTLIYTLNQLQKKDETADNTKKIQDYQSRVYEKDYRLGTIAVRTICNKSAQEVYGLLKSRMDIEKAFDIFKNILESDKNYMRDQKNQEKLYKNWNMYYLKNLLLKKVKVTDNNYLKVILVGVIISFGFVDTECNTSAH
jgi:hypothetical protein